MPGRISSVLFKKRKEKKKILAAAQWRDVAFWR